MKSMEERIEDAIVARFFEPSWMMTTQYIPDPQTGMSTPHPVNSQIPAPMSTVAQAIYDHARAEIVRRVMEKLDIDAIVTEWAPLIAKDVIKQLQTVNDGHGWRANPSKSEREKMLEKVYEAVAEEFGRQCVAHLKTTGGLLNVLEGAAVEPDQV